VNRSAIARILKETGILLELRGENPFRVRAYENAARAVEGMVEEPEERLEAGTLAEIPGIGPGLVASIGEILQTGRLALNEELRARVPPGLLELYRLPGLGSKRIRTLHETLGIGSPAELEAACREGRVAALPGFGAKTQAKILEGLARLDRQSERHLISDAEAEAERLLAHLREHPSVIEASVAGSLRRRCETVGDLDFVAAVAPDERDGVAAHFAAARGTEEILASGDTKVSIRGGAGFQADLRMVSPDQFATALHHFTGSREHNVELRGRAKRQELTINEYGLFRDQERIPVEREEDLYAALSLAWVPPEMREGAGEVELAEQGALPELVDLAQIRGTFHVHTTWSDGIATIEQMAAAAADRGWEYLGIADHSQAAAYAGGLGAGRLREQWREIDAWNERGEPPFLFKGTECDILSDGALDYPDEILLELDFVVVSVHSRFRMPVEQMTARIVRAVSHPCATFLGHPTGRLLLGRDGYELDLDAVLEAARSNGVMPEINANPHRLDIDWRPLRGWLAEGGRTSIHPDAHSPQGLADVRYGVGIARKAGARAEDVLNTLPLARISELFGERRERAREILRPRSRD